MTKTVCKYGSLVIGLIAAIVIILSQSFSLKPVQAKKHQHAVTQANNEKSNESSSDTSVQTIAATSFPASAQLNFFQEAICLFEVIFSSKTSFSPDDSVDLPLGKFFSTIFRVIISPNAP
jgi:hypothetical protein